MLASGRTHKTKGNPETAGDKKHTTHPISSGFRKIPYSFLNSLIMFVDVGCFHDNGRLQLRFRYLYLRIRCDGIYSSQRATLLCVSVSEGVRE